MIPKIIHLVWLGSEPFVPPENVEALHPDWSIKLWNEDSVFHIFGLDVRGVWDELGSWAAVSNYIRLLVLKTYGGFYMDCDFTCHKSLEPLRDNAAVAAEQDGGRLCNAFLGAIPDHWWINWQLAHWNEFDQHDPASGVYLASAGPREGLTIVPQHLVYPWLYDAPMDQRKPHADSLLSHHWKGTWNLCKIS